MQFEREIVEASETAQSFGNYAAYYYCKLRWKERLLHLSDDAKVECQIFKLDVYQIVGMLEDQVKCPKYRQFHRKDKKFKTEEIEICSKKDRKIFRIIYCEDNCIDVKEICWLIIHVKPA
jgi:hypothetical protein